MATSLTADPAGYDASYVRIRADARRRLRAAALPPDGATDRMIEPQERLDDLERYDARLSRALREGTLNRLPCARHGERFLPDVHVLDEGPFRGVFLVDTPGRHAYAILFSAAPHDMSTVETIRAERGRAALRDMRDGRP